MNKCPCCDYENFDYEYCFKCYLTLKLDNQNKILYCNIIITLENINYIVRFSSNQSKIDTIFGNNLQTINESFLSQLDLNNLYLSCKNILIKILKLKEFL